MKKIINFKYYKFLNIFKMSNIKFLKDKIVKYKVIVKKFMKYLLELNSDWVFVVMFSYFIFQNLAFYQRILGSIGATYIYYMIINSIKELKNAKR
jgi:hypothetical protein